MRQLKITNKITNRESLALDKYLNEISKIDLLTVDEEADLARRIRNGDNEALERLTRANLRFVISVAKQYQNHGISLSDLINEGNVGLIKAAKRFDETKGFKFISYAVWWIRQSILASIVEYSRLVRLPVNKVNMYSKVNQANINFIQQFEREPTLEELGELLEMAPKDVGNILQGAGKHVSTDAPLGEESSTMTILDKLSMNDDGSPDISLMKESLKKEVAFGLQSLSPREAEVLTAYYGFNGKSSMTLEEIGDNFGLTRERVRQIRDRAIRRLKRTMDRSLMKSFL